MSDSEVLVVGAREVAAALEGREASVLDAVRKAYETHARGASALPHSSFLRFPVELPACDDYPKSCICPGRRLYGGTEAG